MCKLHFSVALFLYYLADVFFINKTFVLFGDVFIFMNRCAYIFLGDENSADMSEFSCICLCCLLMILEAKCTG